MREVYKIRPNKNTMEMIKTIAMIATLFVAVFAVSMVAAEDVATDGSGEQTVITAQEPELADAGVEPDSALYGLDRAMERISLALTFDKAKRAEKALKHAEERLAEVKAMIEANKLDKAEEAQKNHEKSMKEAEDDIAEIESDGDAEKAKGALEDVSNVEKEILSHSQKVALVKDTILAKMAGKNMSAEKIARITAVFDKIKAKAVEVEDKSAQKREQVSTKYKALTGKTDEEVEEVENQIDEESGLAGEREKSGKSSSKKGTGDETANESENPEAD